MSTLHIAGSALLALVTSASPLLAQQPPRPAKVAAPQARRPSTLERADSAFDAEDREAARRLYAAALAEDSTRSRAVFRLAQLEANQERALALYRRYQAMEPRDAWGHMAVGDLLGRMGRPREGLVAYARAAAIVPGERDVAIGTARLQQRAGHPLDAANALAAWNARHASDGEALDLEGRAWLRAGRPRAAERAFTSARAAGGVRGVEERQLHASALAAPAIEPLVGYMRDSDGNRTARFGASADVMIADGTRLGAGGERLTIGDGVDELTGTNVFVRLASRPTPGVRFDVQGGAVRLVDPFASDDAWTLPQGEARLRLRSPNAGPSLELRAQAMALGTAPILVRNRVARHEARATVELPLAMVRLRASGRAGQLVATGESANRRFGAEGGLVVPVGSTVQLSGQYRWMGFQRESQAGYFAPRAAETVEGGMYVELGGDGRVSLAADVGGGAQRVARQGENAGRWTRALRAWSYAAVSMGAQRALYVELEAYDAPFAPQGVATSGSWQFMMLSLGVRWGLR